MLSDSKSYTSKMSRKLAILPEEIQRLVHTTAQKPRQIVQTFEEALHLPVGDSIQVSKPNEES